MVKEILINTGEIKLAGHLSYTGKPRSWVIFAHGSGSSRLSPRNNEVAAELNRHGHATLLFDLLTREEDENYSNRFNIPLLAKRLELATFWLRHHCQEYEDEPIAYFGASTGAGAALIAAAEVDVGTPLYTVISRGGRPDLAGKRALNEVFVPVLLVVGDLDYEVIKLNEAAENELKNVKLALVPGATHLFEEPGTLDQVVDIVLDWLNTQLPKERPEREGDRDGSYI